MINHKAVNTAVTTAVYLFAVFELKDSFDWMFTTEKMFTKHDALGSFVGYELINAAADEDRPALIRFAWMMGKWVGMAKFFLTGAILSTATFGSLEGKVFFLGWGSMSLGIMSLGLYPTLNEIRDAHPEDFSPGGVDKFWKMETGFGMFSFLAAAAGAVSLATKGKQKSE